jgi:nitric oxide reductase NorE protein
METTSVNSNKLFYPPGGLLIWIVIFLELITFGMALIAMVYYGKQEPELFHKSRLLLNVNYGAINTIVLLTSGFFMAESVRFLKLNNHKKASLYLVLTILFGFLFLVIKSIEYYFKIELGYYIGYNTFFSFYWMLTLFHVIHVMVGLTILISLYKGVKNKDSATLIEDVEASAVFWHMCDLIWLLIFPVIYLLF